MFWDIISKMPVKFATIDELYKREKSLKKDDVQKLAEWAHLQAHLPRLTELQLIIFLHSCYYSIESAKTCIDNYYTIRALCPEFFAERNPTSKELTAGLKLCCICPLPKLTPTGNKVLYSRLTDCNPEHYNFNTQTKLFDMTSSLLLAQEGTHAGHILIVDLQGVVLGHLLRIGIMGVKKYMYFLQEALPVRLKGFHFVNCVSFMDKILAMMKPFMKKELMDILFLHQNGFDSLYEHVPKDCLPNNLGGSVGSIHDIHASLVKNMIENTNYFINEELEIVDETKRQGKPKNSGDFFGVEGTFKKLDID